MNSIFSLRSVRTALAFLCSLLLAAHLCGCEESDFSLDDTASTPYEADILYVRIDDASILKSESDTLFRVYDENPEIGVNVDANVVSVSPRFVLTEGASILMQDTVSGAWTVGADGVARDFSRGGNRYMVVSANGKSHHLYTLTFNRLEMSTEFHFEWFALNDSTVGTDGELRKNIAHYYTWKEYDEDGAYRLSWCTANGGYGISKVNNSPEDYPTVPCKGVGGGYGVQLTTMPTGGVAEMMGIRLAAGNLFLGEFDVSAALRDPVASTRFGIRFNKKPLQLRGWMSYVPGERFQDRDGKVLHISDSCDIYAVLYRNQNRGGDAVMLDGNTVGDSPYLVAKATLDERLAGGTGGEWVYFTAEFDYDSYSEPLDAFLLGEYGYSMSIVATSSRRGGNFCGAIGSMLKVDELELVCEK